MGFALLQKNRVAEFFRGSIGGEVVASFEDSVAFEISICEEVTETLRRRSIRIRDYLSVLVLTEENQTELTEFHLFLSGRSRQYHSHLLPGFVNQNTIIITEKLLTYALRLSPLFVINLFAGPPGPPGLKNTEPFERFDSAGKIPTAICATPAEGSW